MADRRWIRFVSIVYVGAFLLPAIAQGKAPTPNFLWWKFDEGSGTVAADSSGNGRDGTIANAQWQAGGAGGKAFCLNFNGTNSTVANQAAGTALNGLSGLTMSMWIKSNATNSDKGFIIGENPAGNDNFCTIRYDAAGANGGGMNVFKIGVTSTSGLQQWESANNVQTTEWQHVAMTWAGGVGIQFYIDGVLDTPTNVQAVNTGTISGCTSLIVGQGGKDAGASWNGLIDDVRIYDYALTADQVAGLLSFTEPGVAVSPSPENAATDIPRDVALGWTAGQTAQKHDVYLGADFADVNDAGAAEAVSLGQTETTYAPAGLEYGRTYYWRVDEVNAAPDSTVFKGDVWSFTVEPYAYPIQNVTATAASSSADMVPANTVNGSGLDAEDQHSTNGSDMWLSDGVQPNWIQFEFDQPYKLDEMWVWNSNQLVETFIGFGAKDVTIEYSTDGENWTTLDNVPEFAKATSLPTYTHNTTVDFGGAVARYVKLTINSSWGGLPQAGLSEVRFFQVPVQARAPQPADAATGVELDAALTWRPGREAASHTVYFSSDANAVAAGTAPVETVSKRSFSPAGMQYGQTYYWRVDEVNEAMDPGVYEGPVWSFTTREFATVDDFETYTDVEGNRIYEFWVDGWDDTANGSIVGHDVAPFAERTIVHGGDQSMIFQYDNSGTATASEATRTFDGPQDWTANGVKSLSLYFQGTAGNGGQLYLKINNTKVPYDGDAADISRAAWLPWNIDLSAVGANLSKVTELTIGVEGAGTTGTLYVDDISLYPQAPEFITPTDPGADDLLALFAFEGNANDTSGNGLKGTLTQGQLVASGRPDGGSALQVNKAGYVDLGNPPSLDFSTTDWTVTAWFKTAMTGTGDANKGTIYGKGGDTGGGRRYCLIMSETTEGVVTLVTDDDVTKYVTDSKSVTNDDEWHSVAGQREGVALRIYIDGVLEGTSTATETYSLAGTSQHNAYIGAITDHTNNVLYKLFNGLIDDVRVYGRALSEGEVLWLAGQTTPVAKPF